MNYQELQEAKQTFRLHALEKDMKPLFKVREDFVRRFSPAKIASMKIDDYVIGRQSKISFCYELERKLDKLGRITGQPSSKFGIWYSPQIGDYKYDPRFGDNYKDAFQTIKTSITGLLEAGKHRDYDDIIANPLNALIKGKILSVYYPDDYLNIFSSEHLDYYLKSFDLDTAELLKQNVVYKRDALLLFGKDVERWNMTVAFRIGRFGSSQADLIIQDRIVCPLIEMPDRVVETLRNKYLVSPIHYEGLRRKEPLEIPESGLREMVCNAIIHKDYTGTFIQMKVFDDHITLWNGGKLPPDYTVEKLMEQHESHPRNRLMANIYYLAGFIEAWGRGYEKIREAFQGEKLEVPAFEEVRGGFMATIKRERFERLGAGNVGIETDVVDVVEKLTERQNVIYKIIKQSVIEDVVETAATIASKIGVSARTVQRDLSQLKDMELIERLGSDKHGHWIPK